MDFAPENTTSEYLDLPLKAFLDLVASGGPAPGGGSVAAIAVALAAGLSGMAARLSAGQLADADELARRQARGHARQPGGEGHGYGSHGASAGSRVARGHEVKEFSKWKIQILRRRVLW